MSSISFPIFLLFKERSPLILTLISGLVESKPTSNLAVVPELPQSKTVFFLAKREPSPLP